MPGLGDVQAAIREALVRDDSSDVVSLLSGGTYPARRFAIHQRHYAASLTQALVDRFPATVWLVGSGLVVEAAQVFIREHPPSRPCLAEYGASFPAYLAACPGAQALPYLAQFAELEWRLGRLALAVGRPPVLEISGLDPERLPDACVSMQPSVQFLHMDWGLDELMTVFLTDREPEQFALAHGEVWLELRGQRGELRMARLTRAAFIFRTTLAGGGSLGEAALAALDVDPAFHAGQALAALLTEGLVEAIDGARKETSA